MAASVVSMRLVIALAVLVLLAAASPVSAAERESLVRVEATDRASLDMLAALGLDVTEQALPGAIDVVLHGADDEALLRASGLPYTVRVPDLAAKDAADRAAERRATRASALPSGRTDYRVYQDYLDDLQDLVTDHPGLVRDVTLPLPSVDGRAIKGVEIATDVDRTDDGRPVYVVMGMHHSREWPSSEVTMEFAMTLANEYAGDPRIQALLDEVRVYVIPVVNPDGFTASIDGSDPNRRKNCEDNPDDAVPPTAPCALRAGVDLNRNYGAYWGGAGAGTSWADETFRGPSPYSEPESEAVHRFSSGLQIVTLITNHTYTSSGYFLRQPGFQSIGNLPDEQRMKALGDSMAAAAGYQSAKGYVIGDITGATEDWNYFAQGTFGYTPELRGNGFHDIYDDAVVKEYLGQNAGELGLREAFLRGGEQAADPQDHSVIEGTAPAGSTLRVKKTFSTATSIGGLSVPDTLESTLTVPASGSFEWHVNPSTRPKSVPRSEAWTLTCEIGGVVERTRPVTVARGERVTLAPCTDPSVPPPPPPGAAPPPPPPTGPPAARRTRLLARGALLSARRVNTRGRIRLRLETVDGRVTGLRGRLRGAGVRPLAAHAARSTAGARSPCG